MRNIYHNYKWKDQMVQSRDVWFQILSSLNSDKSGFNWLSYPITDTPINTPYRAFCMDRHIFNASICIYNVSIFQEWSSTTSSADIIGEHSLLEQSSSLASVTVSFLAVISNTYSNCPNPFIDFLGLSTCIGISSLAWSVTHLHFFSLELLYQESYFCLPCNFINARW